jgi:hypothetical protein
MTQPTANRFDEIDVNSENLFRDFRNAFSNMANEIQDAHEFFTVAATAISNLMALFIFTTVPNKVNHAKVLQELLGHAKSSLEENNNITWQ